MSLQGNVQGGLGASVDMSGLVGGSIEFTGEGTDNYNELDNKPSINGVVLQGNKTSEELHIEGGGTDNYNELNNKPKINNVTLQGNVTDTDLAIDYEHLTNKPVIPDITVINQRLDNIEQDILDVENDIDIINTELADVAADIATLKASDLVQNNEINNLKNRLTAAETTITYHTSQISNLETDTTALRTDINALDGRLDSAEDDIIYLQNGVGDPTDLDIGSDCVDGINQLNTNLAYSTQNLTLQNMTAGTYQSFIYKSNGTVTMFIDGTPTTEASLMTIYTLPQQYRPPIRLRFPLTPLSHSTTNLKTCFLTIDTDGTVQIYMGVAARVFANVSYSVKN